MKYLIDVNVILDFITDNDLHADYAQRLIALGAEDEHTGMILTNDIALIHRAIEKNNGTKNTISFLKVLLQYLEVVDVTKADVYKAINGEIDNYEDAIIVYSALRVKADYIVTRNIRQLERSVIPTVSPKNFMDIIDTGVSSGIVKETTPLSNKNHISPVG